MDTQVFLEYEAESQNWLKEGRRHLVRHLLRRYVNGAGTLRLLEVGAGVGQNLPELLPMGSVDVVESNPLGLRALRRIPALRSVYDQEIPFNLAERYDVICALDVIEHIADDAAATRWISGQLRPHGIFVATVPAYNRLFSDHDRALGHHRRYSKREFLSILPSSLRIASSGYFNTVLFPIAAVTRLASEHLRGRRSGVAPRRQSSRVNPAMDRVLGGIVKTEARLIGRGVVPWFGLSVFCVAVKRADAT
jgi:SAM-dependent methyltransferase